MILNFPSNNNGDVNGISNSGIEMFQGNPLKSLARESTQNVLDAALNSNKTRIEFEMFNIKKDDLPNFEELKEVFDLSHTFWKKQNSTKAKDFFENAIKLSSQEYISVLRISDFNTKGLEGSDGEYNTPWCNLTKSSGTSDKSGSTGGSFGIGKFAPFACSAFRTVFYNTVAIDNKEAFQGISRLTSFRKDNGEITTGVGYFGDVNNKPIFQNISLQKGFKRKSDETGTDIYILGFKYSDWQSDVILSILDGFLYAIYNGNLEVVINKDIIINSSTLEKTISEYVVDTNSTIREYYDVLTSNETNWTTTNFKNKGILRLGILLKDTETKRKVAMIRKTGMKIKDQSNINSWIQFTGVMYFEGEDLNKYLISMENPEHTKWEPFRVWGHEKEARMFLRDINVFIKESLDTIVQNNGSEEFDPMLGDLLPFDVEDEKSLQGKIEMLSDDINEIEKKQLNIKIPKTNMNYKDDEGISTKQDEEGENGETTQGSGNSGKSSSLGGKSTGDKEGKGNGEHETIKEQIVKVMPSTLRIICTDKDNGIYSINFIPAISASKCLLELYIVAETDKYKAKIIEVKGLGSMNGATFTDNKIENIELEKGVSSRFRIKLDTEDYNALEVNAYGIKI